MLSVLELLNKWILTIFTEKEGRHAVAPMAAPVPTPYSLAYAYGLYSLVYAYASGS